MLGLEYLGWGWFLGLGMIFAAGLVGRSGLDRVIRVIAITYGVLGIAASAGFLIPNAMSAVGFVAWGPMLLAFAVLLVIRSIAEKRRLGGKSPQNKSLESTAGRRWGVRLWFLRLVTPPVRRNFTMDIPRIFNITESAHRIHNPITPDKLATLGAALRLESGARVLDLGSGSGEMLCTWARDHGVIGTGIDMSPLFTEHARLRAEELGVADRLKFIHGDAARLCL